MTDLLIKGGSVVDGTGAPARDADLLIRDGRILEIGSGLTAAGAQVIYASVAIVAPGFTFVKIVGGTKWPPLATT